MKGKIALFLHQPKCSVQSGNGIMQALQPDYQFKIFTKHRLEKDFFDDVDMIAVPGGLGDSDSYASLMRENAGRIQDFVAKGGRYLGVCMGAYWAGHHYLNILDGVKAYQYITRPNTDTRRPHAKAIDVDWLGQPEKMYFYDGPALVGDKNKFTTVSTYANGDAMSIYQNRIGLIGCHPEANLHWYQAYPYMLKHWHQGRHHSLLKDFVDKLMLQ
jgi:Biotin-protein ligase, N terminal